MTEFTNHLNLCGYRLDAEAIGDGKLRRVAWHGRKPSDKTGWYVAHDHGDWSAAVWGDWREGVSNTWCSREPRKMTTAARVLFDGHVAAARAAVAAEQEAARAAALSRAWVTWCRAELVDADTQHEDLDRKQISPAGIGHRLRTKDGDLLVPLRDSNLVLGNVQRINPDGTKRFVRAAAVAGMAWVVSPLPDDTGDVVICEGAATAATLREITGGCVVAAMNAGNLEAVATWVRARCPVARIIIAADDDRWERDGTPRAPEKNVGKVKARAAATAVNGLVVVPVFASMESRGTDWNDLWCEEGGANARAKWATAVKVASLDVQVGVMSESDYQQRKPLLAAAYRAAGAGAVGPKSLDLKRKEAAAAKATGEAGGDVSPAAVLSSIIDSAELWHDHLGKAVATFELDGIRVNSPVDGQMFRDWLRMAFEDIVGKATPPGKQMVDACVDQAAARARRRGLKLKSFTRIGWNDDGRWIDLGRSEWNAVRYDATGWDVVSSAPVKFVRGAGGALPVPVRGGTLDPLWDILNVVPEDRCLIAGWLLGCLLGNGPAFGLDLHGGQGTAKTSATRILRRLIDPAPGLTQSLNERRLEELPLTCLDQWIPCFENISWLTDDMQDTLCQLTTGLSIKNRQLYTNSGIETYVVQRPWIINGINNVCTRGDLSERAVPVGLVAPKVRRTESEIEAAFESAQPVVLGALLDAASMASRLDVQVQADLLLKTNGLTHRMADALRWITSGEESFGFPAGSFIRRLNELQEESGRDALENHPLVLAILDLLKIADEKPFGGPEWTGTNDDLLAKMVDFCPGNRPPKNCDDARKVGMWLKREGGRIQQVFGINVGEAVRVHSSRTSPRARQRTITRIEKP